MGAARIKAKRKRKKVAHAEKRRKQDEALRPKGGSGSQQNRGSGAQRG